MFRKKITQAHSGHELYVMEAQSFDLAKVRQFYGAENYTQFYVVRNFDATGVVFFYLAKGHAEAPNQFVVWYPNGKLWGSYGVSIKEAIEGAQRDGWLYATPDSVQGER